ncbi:MAG: hypothetical protein KAI83_00510 [Thiomargarita sp.]|nr:hypothetical protein [Thiomargarita sp.]
MPLQQYFLEVTKLLNAKSEGLDSKIRPNLKVWTPKYVSRSQTLFGNAFHDALRRVLERGASMNGFPNRVWKPETEFGNQKTRNVEFQNK